MTRQSTRALTSSSARCGNHRSRRLRAATRKRPRLSSPLTVLDGLLNILDGDQSFDMFVFVNDQQLLDAMFCSTALACSMSCRRNSYERLWGLTPRLVCQARFERRHDGDDADEMARLIDHRHAADMERCITCSASRTGRSENRTGTTIMLIRIVLLYRLPPPVVHAHVLVNDSDAALLSESNRERRFCHRSIAPSTAVI